MARHRLVSSCRIRTLDPCQVQKCHSGIAGCWSCQDVGSFRHGVAELWEVLQLSLALPQVPAKRGPCPPEKVMTNFLAICWSLHLEALQRPVCPMQTLTRAWPCQRLYCHALHAHLTRSAMCEQRLYGRVLGVVATFLAFVHIICCQNRLVASQVQPASASCRAADAKATPILTLNMARSTPFGLWVGPHVLLSIILGSTSSQSLHRTHVSREVPLRIAMEHRLVPCHLPYYSFRADKLHESGSWRSGKISVIHTTETRWSGPENGVLKKPRHLSAHINLKPGTHIA